jgi:hypothetical protein
MLLLLHDSKIIQRYVNASKRRLKNLKSILWSDYESNKDIQKRKKDGPYHPFLPNQTYFYEKNLKC